MANPAVSLISKRAPVGDRFLVTATLTWATYAQAAADKVTAQSLGLVYIDEVWVDKPNLIGVDGAWDGVKGATPGFTLWAEDSISGKEVEVAAGSDTTILHITALGF
jgi:hypothetical protein